MMVLCSSSFIRDHQLIIMYNYTQKILSLINIILDENNNGTNSFTFAYDLNILNTCSAMWLNPGLE